MAERLEHTRPLWCIDVAGPLESGRTALIIRIHHCLADGVTALRMLSELLWDPDGATAPPFGVEWRPRPAPGTIRLFASGARDRLRGAAAGIAGGVRGAASPRRWRESGRVLAALPAALRRELWPLGAPTAFDRRIGCNREAAFAACELADLKRIEHAAGTGVTVNDVVLAMVAGAIRRWLKKHHERTVTTRVQVPASMHHRNEDPDSLGNRDSFLFCELPVFEPDPLRRLLAINAETRSRKGHTTTRTSSTPSSTASRTSGPSTARYPN